VRPPSPHHPVRTTDCAEVHRIRQSTGIRPAIRAGHRRGSGIHMACCAAPVTHPFGQSWAGPLTRPRCHQLDMDQCDAGLPGLTDLPGPHRGIRRNVPTFLCSLVCRPSVRKAQPAEVAGQGDHFRPFDSQRHDLCTLWAGLPRQTASSSTCDSCVTPNPRLNHPITILRPSLRRHAAGCSRALVVHWNRFDEWEYAMSEQSSQAMSGCSFHGRRALWMRNPKAGIPFR